MQVSICKTALHASQFSHPLQQQKYQNNIIICILQKKGRKETKKVYLRLPWVWILTFGPRELRLWV